MFHFKAETDAVLVDKAFHASNNIGWMHDDRYKGSTKIPYNPDWLYLSCYMDGEFVGSVFGLPDGEDLNLHIAFLRPLFGKSVPMAKLALDWAKANLPEHRRYWASVTPYNELAKRFVEKLGFVYARHDSKGWFRDGKEWGKDVYLYSV